MPSLTIAPLPAVAGTVAAMAVAREAGRCPASWFGILPGWPLLHRQPQPLLLW